MIRLKRFKNWNTDKLHGNSLYEDELKRTILEKAEKGDILKKLNGG